MPGYRIIKRGERMIIEAKEEDLKKLSRRGFLRIFSTAAPAAIIAPRKTFVFFGDILRRPAVTPYQGLPPELFANPSALMLVGAVGLFAVLGMPGIIRK